MSPTSPTNQITFTPEQNGDGNSDIYGIRPNGSDLDQLVATSLVEDSVVLSPNGSLAASVSTANGMRANIWVLDMITGDKWNITNIPDEWVLPPSLVARWRVDCILL